ncbi:MAG: hypothetical protein AUJ75_00425 [Candidatus Omnitrophica bacterium CG1_02_49_10]|nr:MAG: hypothetical protein AUJ75_00425 [Candidatus Omnitrophica bacterium CG1_02_49_10]
MFKLLALILIPVASINSANRIYEKGDYDGAVARYEEALKKDPDSEIANYNKGNALYRKERYGEAVESYNRSAASQDEKIEAKASYNLGNAKFKEGSAAKAGASGGAEGLFKESLDNYKRAMELDPADEDAKYNYEFVKRQLESLKEEDKEEEKKEQKEQKEENKGEQKDKGQQADNKEKASPQDAKELSKKEAEKLLESFGEEQRELEKDYKEKQMGGYGKVLKDW